MADKDDESTLIREIDITKESEFPVTASVKDAKVLSDHPKESYELVATGPKASTLKVKDPVAFWKGSKYLIVLVPD